MANNTKYADRFIIMPFKETVPNEARRCWHISLNNNFLMNIVRFINQYTKKEICK